MAGDILRLIEQKSGSFSKGQRRIAEFVRERYDEAACMTAARLASETAVSEPTVVRFAVLLGFEGYPEFIHALGEYARSRVGIARRFELSERMYGGEDVAARLMSFDADSIRRTQLSLSRADFCSAAKRIAEAASVYIVGAGANSFAAQFLYSSLFALRKGCHIVKDGAGLIHAKSGDAVIVISYPRYLKACDDAAEFAKSKGAYILCFSDSETPSCAKAADTALLSRQENSTLTAAPAAAISLLNAFVAAVALALSSGKYEGLAALDSFYLSGDILAGDGDD